MGLLGEAVVDDGSCFSEIYGRVVTSRSNCFQVGYSCINWSKIHEVAGVVAAEGADESAWLHVAEAEETREGVDSGGVHGSVCGFSGVERRLQRGPILCCQGEGFLTKFGQSRHQRRGAADRTFVTQGRVIPCVM